MKNLNDLAPLLLAAAAPTFLASVIAVLPPGTAAAVDAAGDAGNTLETVTVTARKMSEDLLKAPVAVQVLTDKDLDVRNIVSLADVANFTPGFTDDQANGAGARADRSFQNFIIRGMNPSTTTNPTASIFINGVPVPADMVQNVGDADRIEVLEGPQSAYFGKDTFAGAINIVSKSPPKELGGYVSVEGGSRQTEDFKFSLGGPLIDDKLSFLGSVDYNSHQGSYRNAANPSQFLGDQSTLTGDFTLLAHPVENLTIKFYGLTIKDHDGPPATGLILATAAGGIPAQSNCVIAGSPWLCGTLPKLLPTSPAQNTPLTTAFQQFLAKGGYLVSPSVAVDDFGLQRNAYFADLGIDYNLPSLGLTVTSLTGVTQDEESEVSDLSNLDGPAVGPQFNFFTGGFAPYTGFPFLTEQRNNNWSQELRIATDPTKPYRFLLGGSYVSELLKSSVGEPGYYSEFSPTVTKTSGVFFSAAYDIVPELTVNLEGRFQDADLSALTPGTEIRTADAHYKNFLPRFIIQYRITPDVMAYATYSEGVNTGAFNQQISILTGETLKFFTSPPYNARVAVQPEKLKNYELGIKGSFLDGKANLTADVYYDKWTNQLISRSYTIPPNSTVPLNPDGSSPDLVGWVDNTGSSTAKGLEVSGNIVPVEHVILNVAGAINDTKYDSFHCLPCATYPGPVNAAGNALPNSPKYSSTVGAQYSNVLTVWNAKDWYVRTDFIYRAGVYLESLNTSRTPSTELVNLRGGVNWQNLRAELFVTNLFNNKAYTSGFPDDNFTTFQAQTAVMLGLPQLVTYGARVRYSF